MNVTGAEMMPFESAAGIQAGATAAASGQVAAAMPKPVTVVNAMTKQVSKVVPMPMDRATLTPVATATSGGFLSSVGNAIAAPFRGIRNLFFGKPTVTATTGITVQRAATAATTSGATGAVSSAAKGAAAGGATVAATTGKSGLGSSIKNMIDEVLPKAEPVSMKLLGKRVLASMAFGIVGNTIKSGYYIATGKWSGGQAWQFMLRDTVKGAVGGAAFGLGLGLTTMALTPLGVAGIPLIIAGMAGGSVASLGSLQLLAQYDGWDWGYI